MTYDESIAQPGTIPGLDDQKSILLQLYALVLQLFETIEEIIIVWDILSKEE